MSGYECGVEIPLYQVPINGERSYAEIFFYRFSGHMIDLRSTNLSSIGMDQFFPDVMELLIEYAFKHGWRMICESFTKS